jgi:RNA polymerase sigma-70 factor (ECF subfamily)
MPEGQDREVLARFVRGDPGAFESLFRRHEAEVFRWVVRIVREAGAAEDVLVEAFLRAYRGRARFDPSRSFGAWMRRIATNAALDQLRTARREAGWGATDDRTPAPAGPDPDIGASIVLAFRGLPPKLQVVATLALVEEQPYAEIADALGLPVGTVKSRVFRAVRRLRSELTAMGIRP